MRHGCYLIPGDICLIRDTAMATYGGNTAPGSKRWMLLVAFVRGDLVQFITTNRVITSILYRLSLTKSNLFHDTKSLVMSPERQRQGIGTIFKLLIIVAMRPNRIKSPLLQQKRFSKHQQRQRFGRQGWEGNPGYACGSSARVSADLPTDKKSTEGEGK